MLNIICTVLANQITFLVLFVRVEVIHAVLNRDLKVAYCFKSGRSELKKDKVVRHQTDHHQQKQVGFLAIEKRKVRR